MHVQLVFKLNKISTQTGRLRFNPHDVWITWGWHRAQIPGPGWLIVDEFLIGNKNSFSYTRPTAATSFHTWASRG